MAAEKSTPMAQAARQDATVSLAHVNTPPAQTWNYLRVNDVSFDVCAPEPARTGAAFNRLPQIFSKVEDGLGAEALAWIEHMADGATYVEVPAHTHREDPIVLATGDDAPFASAGVIVREGASATICLTASGTATNAAEKSAPAPTTGSALRVICERGASVEIVEIVASPDGHQHLEAIGVDCAEHASAVVRQYALGGAKVAMGLAANLAGDSAHVELTNRYVVRDADLLDVNHVVRQRGRNTTSDLSATGVLLDDATKTMRETIDLIHGAKNSRGNELECVLVCGDGVTNKTLPTILCDEEDVQGNHGATIGTISPEQLAYLACRGLSEADVEALFSRAIFDDALAHAVDAPSREAVARRAVPIFGDTFAEEAAIMPADATDAPSAPADTLPER